MDCVPPPPPPPHQLTLSAPNVYKIRNFVIKPYRLEMRSRLSGTRLSAGKICTTSDGARVPQEFDDELGIQTAPRPFAGWLLLLQAALTLGGLRSVSSYLSVSTLKLNSLMHFLLYLELSNQIDIQI